MKKLSFFAGICVLLLCSGVYSYSQTVDFSRGLPTANLNNAAGADRSNVAWADGETGPGDNWAIGDTFNLGPSGTVDATDIRVWVVGNGTNPLSSMWSDLTLFVGDTNGNIQYTSTVNTNLADPNVIITPITYAGGSNYQGSSGNFIQMYQVDFLGNWAVNGSQDYTFYVGGTPASLNTGGVSPFLSASNAALSDTCGGCTQQYADGKISELEYGASNNVISHDTFDSNQPGVWDKSSDINVEVLVPEGGSQILYLLLAGAVCFGALIVSRRMRSANA